MLSALLRPPLPSLAPEALDQVCFSPLSLRKIRGLFQEDVSGRKIHELQEDVSG
jgi:hypothetical protein